MLYSLYLLYILQLSIVLYLIILYYVFIYQKNCFINVKINVVYIFFYYFLLYIRLVMLLCFSFVLVVLLLYLLFLVVSDTVVFVTLKYRVLEGLQGIPPDPSEPSRAAGVITPSIFKNFQIDFMGSGLTEELGLTNGNGVWYSGYAEWFLLVLTLGDLLSLCLTWNWSFPCGATFMLTNGDI